ncbi:MAG: UDP-N-acetylmuramoyl-tripeptide--D-alanyl-D-alanine ligase, partial [Gammaproteobacteria bacterium]
MRMTLAEAAVAMQGVLRGPDAPFLAVSTDSRRVSAGSLFFALSGAHHDGHEYVPAALAAGAAAAVVCREEAGAGAPCIVVDDTQLALGRLALAWRLRLPVTVVAITGNSGKTTTKELTAAVLRSAASTLATPGNYNNEIGMPLTLLQLDAGHRYAVIEMGQGRPGDIAYLAGIARPAIALVTNVTGAHLGGFGSMEAIAAGKAEVYASLAGDGVAIVNLDDRFSGYWL